jgi:hypothetical protein
VQYEGEWADDQAHGCVPCQAPAGFQATTPSMTSPVCKGLACFACWGREGKARYEDSGAYVGEFRREQRSGWGRHAFPSGDVYEGEWLADKIHGALTTSSSRRLFTCNSRGLVMAHACCIASCRASSLGPPLGSHHAALVPPPERAVLDC